MESRRDFVERVIYGYADLKKIDQAPPVLSDLVDFVLDDVLDDEPTWANISKEDPTGMSIIEMILRQCLERIIEARPLLELQHDDLRGLVRSTFIDVVHQRWNCPVPFILC